MQRRNNVVSAPLKKKNVKDCLRLHLYRLNSEINSIYLFHDILMFCFDAQILRNLFTDSPVPCSPISSPAAIYGGGLFHREVSAIVVDLGSHTCKASNVGEDAPKAVFPSVKFTPFSPELGVIVDLRFSPLFLETF
ncbi:hypothetical protein YC2023_118147 [Brassica napus]